MSAGAIFKKKSTVFFLLLLAVAFAACENDLQHIKRLTQTSNETDTDSTKFIEVIYSDSARVRFKMNAPLMLSFKGKNPRNEAPKGVRIAVYNDRARKDSTIITAKYAVATDGNQIFTLRNDVVLKNVKGDVFKSEELVLNQMTKKVSSSKPSTILMHDGNLLSGTTFKSNDDLSNPTFTDAKGIFNYKNNGELMP